MGIAKDKPLTSESLKDAAESTLPFLRVLARAIPDHIDEDLLVYLESLQKSGMARDVLLQQLGAQ